MCSFKSGDDSKNKLKGVSKCQTKHIEFEDLKKSLNGEEYQRECNNFIFQSINHEMHIQEGKNIHFLFSMTKGII